MKKIFPVIIILATVCSFSAPAFAAQVNVADGATVSWGSSNDAPNYTGTLTTGIYQTTANFQNIAGPITFSIQEALVHCRLQVLLRLQVPLVIPAVVLAR